ncbi:hypothetical protein ACOSP7_027064 [Xanthoceras sorbifolium]
MSAKLSAIWQTRNRPGRGIDLNELWNTFVPMVVNQHGWEKFMQKSIRGSLKVFLTGSPVYVKGCQVYMSVEAINEYYGLETNVNHVDEEVVVAGGPDSGFEQPIPPPWVVAMLISLERRLDG